MSEGWINAVLDAMDPENKETADLIRQFLNDDGEIQKVITALDKNSGEFNVINFGTHKKGDS